MLKIVTGLPWEHFQFLIFAWSFHAPPFLPLATSLCAPDHRVGVVKLPVVLNGSIGRLDSLLAEIKELCIQNAPVREILGAVSGDAARAVLIDSKELVNNFQRMRRRLLTGRLECLRSGERRGTKQ